MLVIKAKSHSSGAARDTSILHPGQIIFPTKLHHAWCAGRIRWYHRTIGEEDPPNHAKDGTWNGRHVRCCRSYRKEQHERYRSFVSWVAIGLIAVRMDALQLKLTLAHSVMSIKKHECTRALRLSLCLCQETAACTISLHLSSLAWCRAFIVHLLHLSFARCFMGMRSYYVWAYDLETYQSAGSGSIDFNASSSIL